MIHRCYDLVIHRCYDANDFDFTSTDLILWSNQPCHDKKRPYRDFNISFVQIEAHWEERSPLIEAQLLAQKALSPTPKLRTKSRKAKDQKNAPPDSRSTGGLLL